MLVALTIVGMHHAEKFIAGWRPHSDLVVSEHVRGVIAAPRLTSDGIPFEGDHLASGQRVCQANCILLEERLRLLTLRDIDVGADET